MDKKLQELFKEISANLAGEYAIIDQEKAKVAELKNAVATKKNLLDNSHCTSNYYAANIVF